MSVRPSDKIEGKCVGSTWGEELELGDYSDSRVIVIRRVAVTWIDKRTNCETKGSML